MVLSGAWEDAVSKAVRKEKPATGWPKVQPERKKAGEAKKKGRGK